MDGRTGPDSFDAEVPSAAILDLHLPELSGKHLCQKMKAAGPSIPIIILTASSDLNDKVALSEMVPTTTLLNHNHRPHGCHNRRS